MAEVHQLGDRRLALSLWFAFGQEFHISGSQSPCLESEGPEPNYLADSRQL